MILGYGKFTIITLSNAGRGGSKKSKPIPAPPHGAGLKFCSIPAPPPLPGIVGRGGLAGRGKIDIRTIPHTQHYNIFNMF